MQIVLKFLFYNNDVLSYSKPVLYKRIKNTKSMNKNTAKNPWTWVPTLYFTQGLPYVIIVIVSVIMYKELGIPNDKIGLYTSWLYLPWVIKPFWSPFVELKSTKKTWIFAMQLLVAILFIIIGFTLKMNNFFVLSLSFFTMAAFASATNDIASDGLYMIALPEKQQSFFMGIRSTFYRLAMVTGQGLIVVLAGYFEQKFSDNNKAWSLTIIIVGFFMAIMAIINFFNSPKIEKIEVVHNNENRNFFEVFSSFFKKKHIGTAIAFILLFRLGESQILKLVAPFLLDKKISGGLQLSTIQVGTIYGTFGVVALTLGGILGGIVISRDGLRKWILPMALSMNVPNIFFLLLSIFKPVSLFLIGGVVVIEQFGYGFGIAAFFMFLIHVANGISKTSHYAIATGFMGLGMMLPGMVSGFIQQYLGYPKFFVWCLLAGIPALFLIKKLDFPTDFGKKEITNSNE